MDENTIKQEVTQELRKVFAEDKPYTDTERLAAYEILLVKVQQSLMKIEDSDFAGKLTQQRCRELIDMIDEEMDK